MVYVRYAILSLSSCVRNGCTRTTATVLGDEQCTYMVATWAFKGLLCNDIGGHVYAMWHLDSLLRPPANLDPAQTHGSPMKQLGNCVSLDAQGIASLCT